MNCLSREHQTFESENEMSFVKRLHFREPGVLLCPGLGVVAVLVFAQLTSGGLYWKGQ
jgi:hypothetical protein